MPSPIGHALGGAICGLLVGPVGGARGGHVLAALRSPIATWATVAAVLPDLDFLWGRHNMETHSLGAALMAGIATAALARHNRGRVALAVTLAWASHVAFDWLGSDDTPPLGVMALWPVSQEFYFAHAYVFEAISRRYWLPNFLPHNLWAIVTECVWLGPTLVVLAWWRGRQTAQV